MKRRDFVKNTGLLTAGAFAMGHTGLAANILKDKTINPFGVQLYSVRDVLPKDPKGVMGQLAAMGYKQFESYSGKEGFLWGLSPKEMKTFLGDIGVDMVSTHFNYMGVADKPDKLKKNIEMAEGAGLKYLLSPYIGAQKSWDDWKRIVETLNKVGEEVNKAGLKFGYHNHDYSFKPLEGKLPQEYLLEHTDPNHVMFELDLCWIDVAGVDTAAHLKKYGNRYELCHVKDYNIENGKPVQCDLGKGSVDMKNTLKSALKSSIKYFMVEQEEYPVSSLESLKHDAAYMKALKV
ncbi:sugar phosphate isomerase/epimerase family protein [Sinomicrobium weinanense]|uniref:Sugar phosphate isomerase/epimerase n=1 Tax=Sinomicrobium weinanense TaxID=2842200 RepID=A0A926JTI5_9FLAO|nr:sugar phosphate isomerase/epimerase [Sinomicrobium weinanense]MBC9797252.1 sugar phosphate isomerase/epimerase [Sinomicrobium weinanense]MBU3122346.1 sugar phosphate isomerase/epimerase [Sinomicrobium weinanense]